MIEVDEERLYRLLYQLFADNDITCGYNCPLWKECKAKDAPCMTDKNCVELTLGYLRGC